MAMYHEIWNKGFAKVTAMAVNCGAGMGLEVRCRFKLYGPIQYVKRLEDVLRLRH